MEATMILKLIFMGLAGIAMAVTAFGMLLIMITYRNMDDNEKK